MHGGANVATQKSKEVANPKLRRLNKTINGCSYN